MSDIIGIRNLETDPHALRGRYQWGGKTVKREDGHYMYVGMGNSYMGSCTQNLAMSAPVGHVIALIARTDDSSFAKSQIRYADELLAMQDGDVYIKAARIKETNRIHEMTISQCSSGVTILGTALYTPEDWEHLYTLYQFADLRLVLPQRLVDDALSVPVERARVMGLLAHVQSQPYVDVVVSHGEASLSPDSSGSPCRLARYRPGHPIPSPTLR